MAMPEMRSESPEIATNGAASPRLKRKQDTEHIDRAAKRRTKRPKDIDDQAIDGKKGVNHAIAHMDSGLMADHVSQRSKRFRPDLSVVESDDIRISASSIRDTSTFEGLRTTDRFTDFLERFAGFDEKSAKHLKTPPGPGSPHTLIIAAAGIRSADLSRTVRKFQSTGNIVAKLFAKHIKLKDATEMVAKTKMGIGVGTPQRISDLINNGSLKLDQLDRIVIDASYIDQKKRGILDMKDTQIALVDLLTRRELKERYDDNTELLFF